MSNKISFVSGKGGVGKSSICFAVAKILQSMGKKLLIVDLDIGLHTQDILLNVSDRVLYNWNDFLENRCDVEATIIKGKIDLIPAPDEADEINFEKFESLIKKIDSDYDFILFDCPAGIFGGFEIGIKSADLILAITTADKLCCLKVNTVNNKIRKTLENPTVRLIINKYKSPSFFENDYINLDEIVDLTKLRLAGVIPNDFDFAKSLLQNQSIDSSSEAYRAINRTLQRLDGQTVKIKI